MKNHPPSPSIKGFNSIKGSVILDISSLKLETSTSKFLVMNLCIFISTWLSRCILKTAALGMKAKFRELERLHLKIIKERSHLKFNEVCLNNDLLPIYTNIYIYIYIYIYTPTVGCDWNTGEWIITGDYWWTNWFQIH